MESRTRPIPAATSIARPATRRREVEFGGLNWIDLPQPVSADIAYLRERLRLDPLALDAVLSAIQRPKLDVYNEQAYSFLIVQVPTLDRDQHITMSEVDLFIGRDYVVTIHDGSLKPLRRLFSAAASDEAARKQVMGRGPGYLLYRVLDTLVKQSFPVLYHLDEEFTRLSSRVLTFDVGKLLQVQSLLERDLITLEQIIQPNIAACESLALQESAFLRIENRRFFGDTSNGMRKLAELAQERRLMVASLGATIATRSVQEQRYSNQLLLIVLLALAPLVALAALAALAAVAPPREQPLVFGGALVLTLVLAAGLLGLARSRRWF